MSTDHFTYHPPQSVQCKSEEIDVGVFDEGIVTQKGSSPLIKPIIDEIAKLYGPEVLEAYRKPVRVRLADVVDATATALEKNSTPRNGANITCHAMVAQPSTSSVADNHLSSSFENSHKDNSNRSSCGYRLVKCQICFEHRKHTEMRRLSGKFERSVGIVLLNSDRLTPLQKEDLLQRLQRGLMPYICKSHIPEKFGKKLPAEARIIAKYRSKCFICRKSRHHFELRQISSVGSSRIRFYEHNSLTDLNDNKVMEIEEKISSGGAVVACIEHFPPKDQKRRIKSGVRHPFLIDEKERLVRIALPGDEVLESRNKKKERTSEARREGRLFKSCHWCKRLISVKEMRGMPNVEVAVEKFFEYARGTSEQEGSLRKRIKESGGRHCRVCYEHFPKEWARARGRYWYVNFFGADTLSTNKIVSTEVATENSHSSKVSQEAVSYSMNENEQFERLSAPSSPIVEYVPDYTAQNVSTSSRELTEMVPVLNVNDHLLNGTVGMNVTITDSQTEGGQLLLYQFM